MAEAMEKSINELKEEFVYLCVRERKKINIFEITAIIFKVCKKCKGTELLTKHPFSFTLDTVVKMAKETNKGDVKSIRARLTKHAPKKMAKAEVSLD